MKEPQTRELVELLIDFEEHRDLTLDLADALKAMLGERG
jgi:hypothetical protein